MMFPLGKVKAQLKEQTKFLVSLVFEVKKKVNLFRKKIWQNRGRKACVLLYNQDQKETNKHQATNTFQTFICSLVLAQGKSVDGASALPDSSCRRGAKKKVKFISFSGKEKQLSNSGWKTSVFSASWSNLE